MADLQSFVGRSFILQRTRYGALDGLVGKVVRVDRVPVGVEPTLPHGLAFADVLVVETESAEFPSAIMKPEQFAEEVVK